MQNGYYEYGNTYAVEDKHTLRVIPLKHCGNGITHAEQQQNHIYDYIFYFNVCHSLYISLKLRIIYKKPPCEQKFILQGGLLSTHLRAKT